MTDETPEVSRTDSLEAPEIRRRAAVGVGFVTFQGGAVRALAFLGNVVLARLLIPADFGIYAFGLTLLFLANALAEGGIGASLIRQRETPERDDLRALLGFQLALSIFVAGATAVAGSLYGRDGLLVAVMVASLPLYTLRMPAMIRLERRLAYPRIVVIELADNVSFYAWAITTAALGWGAWSLTTGVVFRAGFTTALVGVIVRGGLVPPAISWSRVRHRLLFGVRFQAANLMLTLREQIANIGTAAIVGLTTLGLWALATRILSLPFLLFTALSRVAFPTMSRLRDAGEDPSTLIELGIARIAVGTAFILVGLVGCAPAAVPAIFGDKWHGAVAALPWASLGLMVGGPVTVSATGYLYSVGDASTPLRSAVLDSLACWAVAFSLLPFIGAAALGLGWMAAGFVDAAVLGLGLRRHTRASVWKPLVMPTLSAVVAAAAGWGVTKAMGETAASIAVAVVAAEGCYLLLMIVAARRTLSDTFQSVARIARASWLREQVA